MQQYLGAFEIHIRRNGLTTAVENLSRNCCYDVRAPRGPCEVQTEKGSTAGVDSVSGGGVLNRFQNTDGRLVTACWVVTY